MHTWYVEGIALKIVDGFWTTTRIVANPISLRYFSIFTFFSNDYSSVTFPFLRNIILEFLFFFVPFSFFFLFDLARIVRPREIPPQFVAPSTDSSTNLNARADRRSTGPVYHPAQRRVLSGSVSYRVGRARPFMPTDFQTRTERAPTYTTRACRGPKWQSCSVSYVTPPRLLCFSLGSLSEIRSIVRSMEGKMKETEDLKKKRGRWDEIGFPRCASLYHRSVQVAVRSSVISYR